MRFLNSMNREVIHKMKETEIRRGDIFSYDFGTRIGSIQSGVRPVLVIQADNFNANAPTVIVASITSVIKKRYLPSHIILGEDFGLTKPSMVLLEQIQTVNKDDLTEYIGFVDDERLWRQINAALKKTFGLFTTRMCEAGVNVKVIQDTLGHKDISTTLNIYTDVTKELRQSEFEGLDSYFKSEYNKVSDE